MKEVIKLHFNIILKFKSPKVVTTYLLIIKNLREIKLITLEHD